MRPFELVKPATLAAAAKASKEPDALIKAAGIDVLDRLKERLEDPAQLVNLLDLRDRLGGVVADGDAVRIGALATLTEIAESPALAEPRWAAVRESAECTGTRQVRNRATAGGNLLQLTRCWYRRSSELGCAHGGDGPDCLAQTGENRYHAIMGGIDCFRVHPSNLAPALIALDATVRISNDAGGERSLSVQALYPDEPWADTAEHTLEPGEILTGIHVPAQPTRSASAYRDSREKESFDWATTAAAVRIGLDRKGSIADARICLGAVAPIPVFAPAAAGLLIGEKPSPSLFAKAAAKAFEGAEPLEQNAYKVELGQAVLRDALAAAAQEAR